MTLLLLPNLGTGELILVLLVVVAAIKQIILCSKKKQLKKKQPNFVDIAKEEYEKRKWEQGKTDEEQIQET
jgi:hypothetical protein